MPRFDDFGLSGRMPLKSCVMCRRSPVFPNFRLFILSPNDVHGQQVHQGAVHYHRRQRSKTEAFVDRDLIAGTIGMLMVRTLAAVSRTVI